MKKFVLCESVECEFVAPAICNSLEDAKKEMFNRFCHVVCGFRDITDNDIEAVKEMISDNYDEEEAMSYDEDETWGYGDMFFWAENLNHDDIDCQIFECDV